MDIVQQRATWPEVYGWIRVNVETRAHLELAAIPIPYRMHDPKSPRVAGLPELCQLLLSELALFAILPCLLDILTNLPLRVM